MVRSLFSILGARQNSILSSATVLMVAVFASKFLGLIRDRLLVHVFTTSETTIFFSATKLPDLIFQLLIFGALSVAFIPVFTDHLHKHGEKDAHEFAANILNLSLLLFILVAAGVFVFVRPLNSLIVPGIMGEQKTTTDQLTQIMLLGQILLVIGSFFVGIAQSYQRFIIPALAPLFYNLGVIIGIGVLSPFLGIMGPGLGVIIGASLHILIQLPLINSLGFRYRFSFNCLNSGVREVVKLMSMRNLGLAAEQINDTVVFALSTLLSSASAPTLLTFSQHLQVVPIGLFGSTIAQAALPVLSHEQAKGEKEGFKITILTTMHQILFLTLPAAAVLIVLRIPVVRLVFGASQFNWSDTIMTGKTVAFLAIGLAAQSISLLLMRSFYALKDTKTPVLASFLGVSLNIALSFIFIKILNLQVWSLGLAYSLTNILSALLMLYLLDEKVGHFKSKALFYPALKMIFASVILGVAMYIPVHALDNEAIINTTRTFNLLFLTLIATIFGGLVYLLMVWLLEVKELETFVEYGKKIIRWPIPVKTEEINPAIVDELR